MKNLLLITLLFGLFACSSSTQLVGSLKVNDDPPKQFNKLAIVAMLPSNTTRAAVELEIEEALKNDGIKAVATFDMFPLAGKKDVIDKMNLGPEEFKELVKQKVNKYDIDGLMIISLLDTRTEERYVGGGSYTITGMYSASLYPEYDYHYYDYYHYAYNTTIYDPGYLTTSTTYFLESNLYDVQSEKLIWTGQSKSTDPSDIEAEAKTYAEILRYELINKSVVE